MYFPFELKTTTKKCWPVPQISRGNCDCGFQILDLVEHSLDLNAKCCVAATTFILRLYDNIPKIGVSVARWRNLCGRGSKSKKNLYVYKWTAQNVTMHHRSKVSFELSD